MVHSSKERHQCLEIQIIQGIIHILSSEPIPDNNDTTETLHLLRKLVIHFDDYKECIQEEFNDLYPQYHQLLKKLKSDIIDDDTSKRIGSYLKKLGRDCLYDVDGNGRVALDNLVEYIKDTIDVNFSEGALRFYIFMELINGNIFPSLPNEL